MYIFKFHSNKNYNIICKQSRFDIDFFETNINVARRMEEWTAVGDVIGSISGKTRRCALSRRDIG